MLSSVTGNNVTEVNRENMSQVYSFDNDNDLGLHPFFSLKDICHSLTADLPIQKFKAKSIQKADLVFFPIPFQVFLPTKQNLQKCRCYFN